MSNIAEEAKRNRGRVSVPRKRTVKKPRLKDTAREFKGNNPPLGFYNLDQEIVRGKNKMLPFRTEAASTERRSTAEQRPVNDIISYQNDYTSFGKGQSIRHFSKQVSR